MIVQAESDEQILATRDVMLQLRPHLASADYLATVRALVASDAYCLAALIENGVVRSVAGYRFLSMLYCGRFCRLMISSLMRECAPVGTGHGFWSG